jgi:hypothetical protein
VAVAVRQILLLATADDAFSGWRAFFAMTFGEFRLP